MATIAATRARHRLPNSATAPLAEPTARKNPPRTPPTPPLRPPVTRTRGSAAGPRPHGPRGGDEDDRDQEGDEKRVEVRRAGVGQHRVVGENEVAAMDEIHQHGQHRAPPEPRAGERAAAALGGDGEEQADRRDAGPQVELKVGRAPDEDVLAEGRVPPRIHRRRGHDHEDPERGDGEAEGQPEAPESENRTAEVLGATERRAGDAREGSAQHAEPAAVDEDVRQDEERVAANGAVPRGIKVHADHPGGAGDDGNRDRDGRERARDDGGRAGGPPAPRILTGGTPGARTPPPGVGLSDRRTPW